MDEVTQESRNQQDSQAERERQRKAAEDQKRSGAKPNFSNEPDRRSPEEQAAAVEDHNRKADELRRESTERAMKVPEHIRDYRGPFQGGQHILDTRGRPSVFQAAGLSVAESPAERAKRELAEETAGRPRGAPSAAEARAFEKNRNDPTARAEVIARG